MGGYYILYDKKLYFPAWLMEWCSIGTVYKLQYNIIRHTATEVAPLDTLIIN